MKDKFQPHLFFRRQTCHFSPPSTRLNNQHSNTKHSPHANPAGEYTGREEPPSHQSHSQKMDDSDQSCQSSSVDEECSHRGERDLASLIFSGSEDGDVASHSGGGEKDLASLLSEEEEHCSSSEPDLESSNTSTSSDTSSLGEKTQKKHRRALSFARAFRRKKQEKKVVSEFRHRLEEAIQGNYFLDKNPSSAYREGDEKRDREGPSSSSTPPTPQQQQQPEEEEEEDSSPKEISLWGIPLLPSKGHPGTDSVLEKFIKAQNGSVPDAFVMLRQTILWRRKERIDRILEEEIGIGEGMDRAVFLDGMDRDGRPLCFNVYGALKDTEVSREGFWTEKMRQEFLRWRIQFMERSIRSMLKFGEEGGADSFVQIADFKNAPGKEPATIGMKALWLFEERYPAINNKYIIVNAPFWYYMLHGLMAQNCSASTRKKFIFVRPNKVTETLLKSIAPQNIPVQYGGLKRENDEEFTTDHEILEMGIKGCQIAKMEFPVHDQAQVTLIWDMMLVGMGVMYKEEFVPDDEGSYKVLIQEKKDIGSIRNSFFINEPGKIVISMKNTSYHRRVAYCRYKCKVTPVNFVHKQL